MADIDKAITRVLDTYKSSVRAKDAGTLMKLYDPKVRVFDTWGIWSYEGAASWQSAVESWFTSLGTETVNVHFEDVQVVASEGFASLSAIVTYSAVSAQGEQLRAMQNRLTWVLKSTGHVLRIVHEHTSAPVGFEDAKAILSRAK
ncbi:YybH family protein [Rubrivivax sp. A210]|uniref:YybH family protein n=1 Tax=Rubrivivax sp. A210 TaxID=2772301 RepID=UPI00191B1C87|nr:nuclear transport factor 2 family protein [Rubrivivax sp. A210]